jgi:hypothetical protein
VFKSLALQNDTRNRHELGKLTGKPTGLNFMSCCKVIENQLHFNTILLQKIVKYLKNKVK